MPAENSRDLERRIGRLEGLFAVLLASETEEFDPRLYESIFRRFRERGRERDYPPDFFFEELFHLLRRSGFPRGTGEFGNRLKNVELQFEKIQGSSTVVRRSVEELSSRFSTFLEKENPSQLGDIKEVHQVLQRELHAYLVARSLGHDPDQYPLHRFVTLRVYLPDDDRRIVSQAAKSLEAFADEIGFEVTDDFPPESGSWFKKWFVKSKDLLTQEQVVDRLRKAERTLEVTYLHRQQAAVDKDQAEAAAVLLKALDGTPSAVCQIGSLLVVKVSEGSQGPRVFTRTLSQKELIFLEQNQHVFKNPDCVLQTLAKATCETDVSRKQLE